MTKFYLAAAAVIAAALLPVAANAQVIDFEDLNNNGTSGFTLYGDNLNSGGYHFESLNHVGQGDPLASWTSGLPSFYTGTVALFLNYNDDNIRMTKVGGGAFDMASIQLTDVFRNGTLSSVTFVGTHPDLSTTSVTVNITDGFNLQTYGVGLTNVDKVEWNSGSVEWTQFDNINVVPEPVSMVALGAGALALLRKRRKA